MPRPDRHGRITGRLSVRGAAAVRLLLKHRLQRATSTSMFERNAAGALAALDGDGRVGMLAVRVLDLQAIAVQTSEVAR